VVQLNGREVSREVIEACRSGDRDAFRTLYGIHKDRVYSIAFYFFNGNSEAAADVTQQVFLKLMTSISQFRGDADFSTWLYRLVVNMCVDSARKYKPASVGSLESLTAPEDHEGAYARTQEAKSVREAVSTLPPKFRIAVLLRYFDDLSYEQMADALHCSMGTVASRLSRGHKLLAERLKAMAGGKGKS